MKKILITGASGFLGWHCSQELPTGWKAYGIFNQNKKGVHDSATPYQADLTDKDALWKVLKEVKPDAVFHLAAYSSTGKCEKEPEATYPLNVTATANLVEMCADLHARFLFTSSEQVFDGEKGQYAEDDQPNAKNEYGKQKQEAESKIKEILPEAVIARIAVLYGHATPAAECFFNQWLSAWEKLLTVTAFEDERRSFLSGSSCASALFHLLRQGAEGVFHIGGPEPFSRYEFGLMAKNILQLPFAKIEGKSQKDVEMPAFRPADLSLNSGKLSGTGFKSAHPSEELKNLKPFLEANPNISLN